MKKILLLFLTYFLCCEYSNGQSSAESLLPGIIVGSEIRDDACNGSSGHILIAFINGGTSPYSFLWSNGATSQHNMDIPAGTYALTVYDAVGDSGNFIFNVFNHTSLPPFITAIPSTVFSCFDQCTGEFHITPSYLLGKPPYTVTSNQGIYQSFSSSGYIPITGICPSTTTTVTITDSNGCTGTDSQGMIAPDSLNPVFSITSSCNSMANGSVSWTDINWYQGIAVSIKDTNLSSIYYNSNALLPGNYLLKVEYQYTSYTFPYYGCPQYASFIIPDLGISCNTIEGNVFVDLNSNCLKDSGEVGIPYTILEFTPGPYYSMTNSSGFFTTNLPLGSYTVTQQLPANIIQTCTSAPDTFTISGGAPYYVINFADSSNIPFDVTAAIGSGIARPGFDFNYSVNVKNLSYEPSGLLTVTLDYDPMLTFVSANPPPFSTSPGQVVWQLNSIQNFQSAYASVTLNVPSNPALIGNTLTASVNVIAANPEIDLTNNSKTYNHIITGSYDPNEKHVTPEGNFLPALNNLIDYRILFQNTGNDTAFNVVIIDTLDADLDVTTFIPGASSHPYETELSGQGIVKFLFNNILLPDSFIDEPNSHGFISFSIKTKDDLQHNTVITNKSDIIFDFNPPITTNAVQSNVDLTLAIDAPETTICEGEPVTLTMIPELQNSNTTWRWRSASCTGNLISYGNSVTVSPSVTTTYFVRDSLNTIPASSCYRKTIVVTPNASSTQNISICNGESITVGTNTYTISGTYVDSLQTAAGCDSVITTNLTVLPELSSTQVISICNGESITVGTNTYSTTGIYVNVFTALNGCDSIVTTDLTVQPPIDTTLTGIDFLIISNALGGSYQWVDCADNYLPIAGETGQGFYPLIDGSYGVIIMQNGCIDTSECVQIIGIGISEIAEYSLRVYPNPTTGNIIIESGINENKMIEITDILGNSIYRNSSVEKKTEIDLSSQSKGIYFIKIIRGENVNVVKIIYF